MFIFSSQRETTKRSFTFSSSQEGSQRLLKTPPSSPEHLPSQSMDSSIESVMEAAYQFVRIPFHLCLLHRMIVMFHLKYPNLLPHPRNLDASYRLKMMKITNRFLKRLTILKKPHQSHSLLIQQFISMKCISLMAKNQQNQSLNHSQFNLHFQNQNQSQLQYHMRYQNKKRLLKSRTRQSLWSVRPHKSLMWKL